MRFYSSCLVVLGCVVVLPCCFGFRTKQGNISEQIRNRIGAADVRARGFVDRERIHASDELASFYECRGYRPAWSSDIGLLARADSLVRAIREADREGLRPDDYHLAALEAAKGEIESNRGDKGSSPASRLADLDIMLTDAFATYASHLAHGKVDPETLRPSWVPVQRGLDYDKILEGALSSGKVRESLRALLPSHPSYSDLRQLLMSFEILARKGGWKTIPNGPTMKRNDRGKRVIALRIRLAASADLASARPNSVEIFDSSLENALRQFQKRHGLEVKGIADSATIAELNVPVEKRIEQIKANMERWRWLPRDLGHRYIQVNVSDGMLALVENGREVMRMKIVFGIKDWPTPLFSSEMTHVIFNPAWVAPRHILAAELSNYIKADSNYLPGNKMKILRREGDEEKEIDPKTVKWPDVRPEDIDFTLRQEPGPLNILGRVKFIVPNKYDVYLHDTPYKEDFAKLFRTFSHGCIRLEKPFDLAEYLLRDVPGWTRQRMDTVIARIEERTVSLKEPVPVHVVYFSTWKARDGSDEFRQDIYGLDERVNAALVSSPQDSSH